MTASFDDARWRESFYVVRRDRVTDHAGTTLEENWIGGDRARLLAMLEGALEQGSFRADNLLAAASLMLEHREWSSLWYTSVPTVEVFERGGRTASVIFFPELVLRAGDDELRISAHPVGKRGQLRYWLTRRGERLAELRSLERLGDHEALLLPFAAPETTMTLALERVAERVPALTGAPLQGPLAFPPFFKHSGFQEFYAEANLSWLYDPRLDGWDGLIPLEEWFPAGELVAACEADGYECPDWSDTYQWL
ncbi:MAG: hypothetical protein H6713_12240 [Myxococcales bacterium]|nr:hypothetical protein [Myxococcales bacterium]MCB9750746.1 hypothetical protein [Myxococcales bacterium]